MPKILTILASALLLGAIVTEVSSRFFADNYFALLSLTVVALIVNGLFVARLSGTPARSQTDQRQSQESSRNKPAGNDNKRGDNRRNDNKRGGDNKRSDNRRGENNRGDRNRQDSKRGDSKRRDDNRADKPKETGRSEQAPKAAPFTPSADAETGTVKWFNRSKGYGFIVRSNAEEIFVHQRSIVSGEGGRPALRDGQQVSFVVTSTEKGVQAEQVHPLD